MYANYKIRILRFFKHSIRHIPFHKQKGVIAYAGGYVALFGFQQFTVCAHGKLQKLCSRNNSVDMYGYSRKKWEGIDCGSMSN